MLHLTQFGISAYLKELKLMLALAIPMLLAQIAQVGTGFVDTVMAGGAGKADLAAVALGSSFFATVFITLMGVMTALNPILAHEFGKNNPKVIGQLTQQGVWFGALLGGVGMLLMWGLVPFFRTQLQVSVQTLDIMSEYLWYVSLGLPAMMMSRALQAYAMSVGKPRVITYVSWFVFFVNIPLNYVLVYGKLGVPAMGGAGCGLATMLVAWIGFISMGVLLVKHKDFEQFGLIERLYRPNFQEFGNFLKLGMPIGLSFFIEVSLFTFIMFLLAKLKGDTETFVATQQIAISLSSIIYMIPQSIGIASTTRVGVSLGRRQFVTARYSTGVAVSFGMLMACLTALLIVVARYPLAGMYTNDGEILALAGSILLFAAAFQLVDAVQCITSASLRGYKLTKMPMLIHIVAFWGCGLIPGYYLAFYQKMGIYGFWWALVISLGVAACLLTWYLEIYSKKLIVQNRLRAV